MLGFRSYVQIQLDESTDGGILHLEHPADLHFDGAEGSSHALNTLRGVANGTTPITRKVDDRISFQVIKGENGKVGVKYKGTGSQYAYSPAELEKNYEGKPYVGALKAVLAHVGKVLPHRTFEGQGGFLSEPKDRKSDGNTVSHEPNTINYAISRRTPEGQKLARSKVSLALHTELSGPNREASPILNTSEFRAHPDVHVMNHVVENAEREILPEHKEKANQHLDAAAALLEDHDHSHTEGHSETLRQYFNTLVESGEKPTTSGYGKWLREYHNKKIAKLKTEKARSQKADARDVALKHVRTNAEAFDRTFQIHHHLQQATNTLAESLGQTAHGGYKHTFAGTDEATGPEGFVAKEKTGIPLKIVDRSPKGFAAANRARSLRFKAKPKLEEGIAPIVTRGINFVKGLSNQSKKVQPVDKVLDNKVRASTEKSPSVVVQISGKKPTNEK